MCDLAGVQRVGRPGPSPRHPAAVIAITHGEQTDWIHLHHSIYLHILWLFLFAYFLKALAISSKPPISASCVTYPSLLRLMMRVKSKTQAVLMASLGGTNYLHENTFSPPCAFSQGWHSWKNKGLHSSSRDAVKPCLRSTKAPQTNTVKQATSD